MRRLIYLCFFCSGFCGLIYEVLWTRLFVLVMGGTVYSFTTVLVAFMTGLALGGFLGGRYADRMKWNPLWVYGLLEGLIGLYCLFIPLLISGLNPVFDRLYPYLFSHNLAGLLVRFFGSGLILVLPTTMMGATLPILVRFQYSEREGFGRTTGLLYAINTLGAVAGSFASGMLLIPALGQRHTLYFAAGLNLIIFFSILALQKSSADQLGSRRVELQKSELPGRLNLKAGLVLFGYALSGAAAMIYQVAWTRALILSLGTTLYVLSLILTAYIAGLALGALVITPLSDRVKRLLLWIGIFEMGIGISAWAVVPLISRLPIWMVMVTHPKSYTAWLGLEFLIGFGLIFVPTFLMGLLLPLVVRLYGQLRGGVGEAVGEVYAWNTIGAIFGSFLTGFFLIAWLGLKNSLAAASVLSLAVGVGFAAQERMPIWAKSAGAAGAAAAIFLIIFLQPGWEPELITAAPYLYAQSYRQKVSDAESLRKILRAENKVLFHKEGAETTVTVFQYAGNHIALRINGKADASTGDDMSTQILLGQIPLLIHPGGEAAKIAVIGLASGITLGSALTHPIREAAVMEISPEVAEASRFFESVSGRPLDDVRTRLIINDARYHLAHTGDRYDVIISEPSNPWIGGEGLLFTKEFFELAKARLSPDGIMEVWIGIYDLDVESVRMIARTFLQSFPRASLWESITGTDYILIGFKGDFALDYSVLKDRLGNEKVRQDLERVGLAHPEKIASRMLLGPAQLEQFAGEGEMHTDDRRQLELRVPKIMYSQRMDSRVIGIIKRIRAFMPEAEDYLRFENDQAARELAEINRFFQVKKYIFDFMLNRADSAPPQTIMAPLQKAHEIDPTDRWVRGNLFSIFYNAAGEASKAGQPDQTFYFLGKAWESQPDDPAIPALLANYFLAGGRTGSARDWVERELERNPRDPLAWMLKGKILLLDNRPREAGEALGKAREGWPGLDDLFKASDPELLPKEPQKLKSELFSLSGEAARRLGEDTVALGYLQQALTINPGDSQALISSAKIFLEQKNFEIALGLSSQAAELSPKDPEARLLRGRILAQMPQRTEEAIRELKAALELFPPDAPGRREAQTMLSRLGVR